MRILLTGAAGFLGSHVTEALLVRGDEVVGLDAFTPDYPSEIKEANAAALARWPGYYLERGDCRDESLLARILAFDDVDAVVHLAGRSGAAAADAETLCADVVVGTAALLAAARAAGVGRFLLGTSAAVYQGGRPPFREDDLPARPATPRAAADRASERLVTAAARLHGFAAVVLRYFTVIGARQHPAMAVARFAEAAATGRPAPRHGDGHARRDCVDARDAARATLAALDATATASGSVRTYNVGSGRTLSVQEMIDIVRAETGEALDIDEQPWPADAQTATEADIGRARRELGWNPQVGPTEALRYQLRWREATRHPTRGRRQDDGPSDGRSTS